MAARPQLSLHNIENDHPLPDPLYRRNIQRPLLTKPTSSFQTAVARIWIGTSFGLNADLWYSEPAPHHVQTIKTNGTTTYVIPTTTPEEIKSADAVYIYVHGGGCEYRRWVKLAAQRGEETRILAPTNPISLQQKWPAQQEALAALHTLDSKSINPSRIILGGDSAGGDLALLYLVHLRDHSPTIPKPSAVVLYSPSIDMTASQTQFMPRIKTDFMFTYSDIVLFNNGMLHPADLPFDTLEISALFADDVSGLLPQLIYYSTSEALASYSERWIERC